MSPLRRALRWLVRLVLLGVVLAIAYLLFWPVALEPQAWTPPPAPARQGPTLPNDRLAAAKLVHPELPGPESIALDAQGRVITGVSDGRILRIADGGAGAIEELGHTGGRPLGIKLAADGRIVIADAHKGLLALPAGGGAPAVLATAVDGKAFAFADDLSIAADGTVYFSDASSVRSVEAWKTEVVEHRPNGRLVAYDPATQKTRLVLGGLFFPNGVALGPDDAYVLVAETASYRIQRVWLTGEKAGQVDVFADNLPGFPDNLTWSSSRRVFWVAIGSPRNGLLDALGPYPFLRKAIMRLPHALQPKAEPHAWVLAFDERGVIVDSLEHVSEDAYASIASVIEHDGQLFLGSFSHPGLARLPAP